MKVIRQGYLPFSALKLEVQSTSFSEKYEKYEVTHSGELSLALNVSFSIFVWREKKMKLMMYYELYAIVNNCI